MGESDATLTKVSGKGDILDRAIRAIRDVGFPMAVTLILLAYMWFVGRSTNDYMARGTSIMERAVNIIEKLEKKLP